MAKLLNNTMRHISDNCSEILDQTEEENTGCKREEDYTGFSVETDIIALVLALLIVISNSFVLSLFTKKKALRTTTNYILASLAFSDLLTGLISIPLFIACNIIRRAKICYAATLILRFTSVSTVLHLLAATTDRYVFIIHAIRYDALVSKKRSLVVIGGMWGAAVFTSLVQMIWLTPDNLGLDGDPEEYVKLNEIRYDIFFLVVLFGGPLVFMAFTYGHIFHVVFRLKNNLQKHITPGWQETRRGNKREWKAVTVFVAMLVVYVVCWLPYFVLRLDYNIGLWRVDLPDIVEYVFIYLRFITSLLNPCLYALGKYDFRKALGLNKKREQKKREAFSEIARDSKLKTSAL